MGQRTPHSPSRAAATRFHAAIQRQQRAPGRLDGQGFSTRDFSWQHPEAWSDDTRAYFERQRRRGPMARRSLYHGAGPRGQWVLVAGEQPRAWADALILPGALTTCEVVVGLSGSGAGLAGPPTAVALLAEALFIVGRCDMLELHRASAETLSLTMEPVGVDVPILTPIWAQGVPTMEPGYKWVVSRPEWEASTDGRAAAEPLSYLRRRLERWEEAAKPRRRRPSFWQRLFAGKSRRAQGRDRPAAPS